MQELMRYNLQHTELTPSQALNNLVGTYAANQNLAQQSIPPHHQQHPQLNLMANGNPALLHQQLPPGARTPGLPGPGPGPPQHFMSPALPPNMLPTAAHLNPALNGSPQINLGAPPGGVGGVSQHTPSPAQTHMQAPGLPGAASSHPSANTSPNVSGKRRRASTVKVETEDGVADGAQGKVKASPRVGGNKRVKSGAG